MTRPDDVTEDAWQAAREPCDYCKDNGFEPPNLCEDCRGYCISTSTADWEAMFYWPDARRRLWFISDRIAKGSLNRSDLVKAFGISVPQASSDIRKWMGMHPGAALYDRRAKCYVPLIRCSGTCQRATTLATAIRKGS